MRKAAQGKTSHQNIHQIQKHQHRKVKSKSQWVVMTEETSSISLPSREKISSSETSHWKHPSNPPTVNEVYRFPERKAPVEAEINLQKIHQIHQLYNIT